MSPEDQEDLKFLREKNSIPIDIEWNPFLSVQDAFYLIGEYFISVSWEEFIPVGDPEDPDEYERGVSAWYVEERKGTLLEVKIPYGEDRWAAARRAVVKLAVQIEKEKDKKK